MLRAELTRQAEHTGQFEAAQVRTTVGLGTLHGRHMGIEVLHEKNRALERCPASTDELCGTVVRLEAVVEATPTEREVWWVSYPILVNLFALLSRTSCVHIGRGTQRRMLYLQTTVL